MLGPFGAPVRQQDDRYLVGVRQLSCLYGRQGVTVEIVIRGDRVVHTDQLILHVVRHACCSSQGLSSEKYMWKIVRGVIKVVNGP